MKQINLLFLTVLSICLFHAEVHADYKDRMKERLPKIIAAKSGGAIGEGVDGLLHVRTPSTSIEKLVSDENADRKLYITETAKKLGGTIEEVSFKLSQAHRKKDKEGYWQKDGSGSWSQK